LPKRVAIAGVGNPLFGDDGVGLVVARELMKRRLPRFVEVMELGTRSLEILTRIEGYSKVVFIDAVRSGKPPGSVTVYRIGEARESGPGNLMSLHELDLVATIRIGRLTGKLPRATIIVGIEPERVDTGLALSQAVSRSISEAANTALEEAMNID
jgi:hydrogenase maturation protease